MLKRRIHVTAELGNYTAFLGSIFVTTSENNEVQVEYNQKPSNALINKYNGEVGYMKSVEVQTQQDGSYIITYTGFNGKVEKALIDLLDDSIVKFVNSTERHGKYNAKRIKVTQ